MDVIIFIILANISAILIFGIVAYILDSRSEDG